MGNFNKETFGSLLKGFRKQKKLSLDGMAALLQVSRGTIVNWEHADTSPPFEICKQLYAMGLNFLPLFQEEMTGSQLALDQKLFEKLRSIIEDELNSKQYGISVLENSNEFNQNYLNKIVSNLINLSEQQQEVFLKQILEDLRTFKKIGEKYQISK